MPLLCILVALGELDHMHLLLVRPHENTRIENYVQIVQCSDFSFKTSERLQTYAGWIRTRVEGQFKRCWAARNCT
jgi:hypothetical protein